MTTSQCKNLIILGASGSIGSELVPFVQKDFENILFIDKNPFKDRKSPDFIRHDLEKGFPEKALKFIEENSRNGIGLINCLGKISSKSFLSLNCNHLNHEKHFNEQLLSLQDDFKNNYLIPISLSNQFANLIISKRGFGSIVNFSSVSSYGNPGQLGYSSMKGAIEIASKVIAREYGQIGITSNSIAPGFMETKSMRENISEASLKKLINKTSVKRIGKVYELYQAIHMLIKCRYINGQTIRVDGDLSI